MTKIHASDKYSYSHAYKTSHKILNTKDTNCSNQISNNTSLTKQDIKISNPKRQDKKISNITPLTHACNNTLAFSSTSPDNFTRPFQSLISQNKYSYSLPQPIYSHNSLSTVTSQPILQKGKEIMQNTISPTILSTKAKNKNITHQACNTLVPHAYDNYLTSDNITK